MKALTFNGLRGGHAITLSKSLATTAAVVSGLGIVAATFLQSEFFMYLCAVAALAAVCAAMPAESDSKNAEIF